MAQTIQIKRSSSTAAPGSNLAAGELAYSGASASHKLYIGHPDGSTGNIVIGGKVYVDMLDHTAGTLTASSALIVDANSKIDVLNVDNITLDGNAITSTDTNGNLTLTPNGTGDLVLDGLNWPQADGSANQYLKTNGSGQLSWDTVSTSFTLSDGSNTDTFSTGSTLTFTAGSGITTTVSNDTVTIASTLNTPAIYDNSGTPALESGITAAEIRTLIGVDAGGTDNSTDVTLAGSYDYLTLSGQQITLDQIDLTTDVTGALPNANLANSAVTIGSTSVSLGATATTFDGLNTLHGIDGSGTDVAGTNLTIQAGAGTGAGAGGSILFQTADGTTSGSGVNSFTTAMTIADDGAVTIAGNLTVNGTTTTVNSNTVDIGDNIILLNSDETGTPSANAGIEVERGTATNVYLRWNETTDLWQVSDNAGTAEDLLTDTNFETQIPTIDGGTF